MKFAFVWLIVMVVMLVLEIPTGNLVTIWFAGGALVSFIVGMFFTDKIWIQAVIFVFVSVALLALTRPLVKKYLMGKVEKTSADKIIGNTCLVTEKIDNLEGTGEVKTDGKCWSARAKDDIIINVGVEVKILEIQGVKVIVEPVYYNENGQVDEKDNLLIEK